MRADSASSLDVSFAAHMSSWGGGFPAGTHFVCPGVVLGVPRCRSVGLRSLVPITVRYKDRQLPRSAVPVRSKQGCCMRGFVRFKCCNLPSKPPGLLA